MLAMALADTSWRPAEKSGTETAGKPLPDVDGVFRSTQLSITHGIIK